MDLRTKTRLLQQLQQRKYFHDDCRVLQQVAPAHGLLNEARNVNQFNIDSIHGRIILTLLDIISVDEIERLRLNKPAPTQAPTTQPTQEKVKAKEKPKHKLKPKGPSVEYPAIPWRDTEDERIQLCIVLYSDRVNSFREMQRLDKVLDHRPLQAGKMVNADARNIAAFKELTHFERHGEFLYLHPITQQYQKRKELMSLRQKDPEAFMNLYARTKQEISRYNSKIKNKKYKSDEEAAAWRDHIAKYEKQKEIIISLQKM